MDAAERERLRALNEKPQRLTRLKIGSMLGWYEGLVIFMSNDVDILEFWKKRN